MSLERQNQKAVLILLFFMVAVGGAYWVLRQYERRERLANSGAATPAASAADYLMLKTENSLLKKLLGQIPGQIVVLGPVGRENSAASGRLVWDRPTQGGYLYASGLPLPAEDYSLWIQDEQGGRHCCGVFRPDAGGEMQGVFQAPAPVFKPRIFWVARAGAADRAVLRGELRAK